MNATNATNATNMTPCQTCNAPTRNLTTCSGCTPPPSYAPRKRPVGAKRAPRPTSARRTPELYENTRTARGTRKGYTAPTATTPTARRPASPARYGHTAAWRTRARPQR